MQSVTALNDYKVIDSGIYTGKSKLLVIHNAGFFSCSTIALQDIIIYYNQNKGLPDVVDRSMQYMYYKCRAWDNLIPYYFKEADAQIDYTVELQATYEERELQYVDYKNLLFENLKPFMEKYFAPSDYVNSLVLSYEQMYEIDYDNTCAVFYRGNDKNREASIASYQSFIDKALEIRNEKMKFLVQPDETEFLQAFTSAVPNCFNFAETPHIKKQDSAVFLEMEPEKRAEFAAYFLAAVIAMSKCKHMIIHTGNCGMWATLYRGNAMNVHQIRDNVWL